MKKLRWDVTTLQSDNEESERGGGREGCMDKDREIRAGEVVRVETDFTLQGIREKLSLAGWLSKAYT